MKLPKDECGAVFPYLMFWIVIVFCALIWIFFDEVLLRVGDWAATGMTEDPGSTWTILVTMFRATPLVILLGAFVYAVVQSHRDTEVGY